MPRPLLLLLILVYLTVGLYPFEFGLPVRTANPAELVEGKLNFPRAGLVRYVGNRDWIRSARDSGKFRLRLQVRSYSPEQVGPARIFTISSDEQIRNLTVGQHGVDLFIRLRTPATSPNGTPAIRVKNVLATSELVTIDISVDTNLTLRVQDQTKEYPLPQDPLSNWVPGFRVAMGNEVNCERPWLGEISQAEVEVAGQTVNCLNPELLEIPATFLTGLKLRRFEYLHPTNFGTPQRTDLLINIFGFMPLGIAVGIGVSGWPGLRRALLYSALVSGLIESLQIAFPNRVTSLVDLTNNIVGGVLGWLALQAIIRIHRWHVQRTVAISG